MEFWKIEMLTSGGLAGYYEVVYMKQETFDLVEKHLTEIETKINELKLLPENKRCFGKDGWWEFDFKYLKEEDQLTYNFEIPTINHYIVYEVVNEVLKKYGHDYNKEAIEIDKYIKTLDCITTVIYEVKKSQIEKLNKFVEELKEEM